MNKNLGEILGIIIASGGTLIGIVLRFSGTLILILQ